MADTNIEPVKPEQQAPIRDEQGRFPPGVSGNPAGRPPVGGALTELMREFLDKVPEGQKMSYKEAFIRKVYKLAMEDGSESAIRLIWNYIDGMPKQQVEHEGGLEVVFKRGNNGDKN